MAQSNKTCTKCGETKLKTEFYTRTYKERTTYAPLCKSCSLKESKLRYSAERDYKIKLKRKYGMSWEEYTALYDKQEGRCAICTEYMRVDNTGNTAARVEKAHVDHCHTTGKVRGLLCGTCNAGIGMLKDSALLCDRASAYLRSTV